MTAMTCSRVTPAFAVRMTITPVVVGEEAWAWATAELVIEVAPIRVKVSAKTTLRSAFIVLVSGSWKASLFSVAGSWLHSCQSSLEFRDQGCQGFGLLVRGEVTAGQALDLEAELAQPFFREVDLPVLERILIAAADQERELIAISLEEAAEVEPIALRLVIGHEARRGGEIEEAIAAAHGVVQLADLGVRDLIGFGPHHASRQLEEPVGASQTRVGPLGEAAQDRRGVPRVGVPLREEPAIEDDNAAYGRPARGLPTLGAFEPASQMLEDDKRGKVERDQRRGLDGEIAPECFDEIGAFGGGIGIVLGLVAVAHADILDEEFRHLGRVRQMRPNLRPAERAIGISRQERDGVRNPSLPLQESLEGRVLRRNDGARFRVVADALANGEPGLHRWTPVDGIVGDCGVKHFGHGDGSFKVAAVAAAFASRVGGSP